MTSEITTFVCGGPCVVDGKPAEHVYDKWIYFDEVGNAIEYGTEEEKQRQSRGGTAVCSRCGRDAMTESLMGGSS